MSVSSGDFKLTSFAEWANGPAKTNPVDWEIDGGFRRYQELDEHLSQTVSVARTGANNTFALS